VVYQPPPPPPPPAYEPEPPRKSPNRRGIIILVVALVASLLVVGVVGGEIYMRHKIKECIASSFSQVGSNVEVGLSAKPVLLQLLTGKLDYVRLQSEESTTGTVNGLTIDAKINGIKTDNGATDSAKAVVTWSAEGMLQTLQQQQFGQLISSLETNNDGTIKISFVGDIATATIRVFVENDTLQLKTEEASFFGMGIDNSIVDNILATINENLSAGNMPFGLKAKAVALDSQGLTLGLEGQDWVPSDEPPPTTTTATPGVPGQTDSGALSPDAPRKVTSCG
jgi:hypothetical protein